MYIVYTHTICVCVCVTPLIKDKVNLKKCLREWVKDIHPFVLYLFFVLEIMQFDHTVEYITLRHTCPSWNSCMEILILRTEGSVITKFSNDVLWHRPGRQ